MRHRIKSYELFRFALAAWFVIARCGPVALASNLQALADEEVKAKRSFTAVLSKKASRLALALGLGLGLSIDTPSQSRSDDDKDLDPQLSATPSIIIYTGSVVCQDIACAGQVFSLGIERSILATEPAIYGEFGLGAVAMFWLMYGGLGARYDADRWGVQGTIFFGTFLNLFARVIYYPEPTTFAGVIGLQVAIPIKF